MHGMPHHVNAAMEGPMQQSGVSPDFFCNVRPQREPVIVCLGGELDVGAAPQLTAVLDDLLEVGCGRIVVDLRNVTFLDSAGVHALVSGHRSAERRGGALSLVRGPHHVQRVFELTACNSVLAFDEAGVGA
jgi:anti-sigma B factor antagonist